MVSFPVNTYDLHAIAFGTRIVTSILDVPRGVSGAQTWEHIACLEFNKVTNQLTCAVRFPSLLLFFDPFLIDQKHRIYDKYSSLVIPLLGTILAGDRASYVYLVEPIRCFPSQVVFTRVIDEAGLETGGDFEGDGGAWGGGGVSGVVLHAYTPE